MQRQWKQRTNDRESQFDGRDARRAGPIEALIIGYESLFIGLSGLAFLELRMKPLVIATLCCIAVTQNCAADITYDLVDHSFSGHKLSGSLTVLDSSPDDGFLDFSNEVVAWQVNVEGAIINYTISNLDDGSLLIGEGIGITNNEIFVSQSDFAVLSINYSADFGAYSDVNALDLEGAAVITQESNALEVFFPPKQRIHAVRSVPEPNVLAFAACLVIVAGSKNRKR